MNGMLSLLFISILMNASELSAMEPERQSPTTKASRARKSRGGRVIARAAARSNPIPIQNSKPRAAPDAIDVDEQDKDLDELDSLENSTSDDEVYEEQESKRWKMLIQAIESADLNVVSALLQVNADLNYINYWDAEFNTPLLCAIFMSNQGKEELRMRNYIIVEKLLENKADVNPRCNSPMQIAQLMGNRPIMRLLEKYDEASEGEEPALNDQGLQCECGAVARPQPAITVDERGNYYDPKNPIQTFDLLMKHQ